ncbi:hypothetical protein GCM10010124_13770 [Pilimelia terevasa]|uniref:Lipoprotein n=1 Tax=Pilimelia terevasa TaxID=53372 RepID=A0A8J3FFW1_9ACTN|nr:hypothetical protein [Pilimelia terevasa]GGK22486.1 hypothetical protein GCM10010124_13770 [Pilimelia terevasa]
MTTSLPHRSVGALALALALAGVAPAAPAAPAVPATAAAPDCAARLYVADVQVDGRTVEAAHSMARAVCGVPMNHYRVTWEITGPPGARVIPLRHEVLDADGAPMRLTFRDTDPSGVYRVRGTGLVDEDTGLPRPQADTSFTLHRRAGVALSAVRSGRYVTTRGVARAYSRTAHRFAPWRAATVVLQSRPTVRGTWVTLSTYRTDDAGATPRFRWHAPRYRYFRMVARGTPDIAAAYGAQQRR